MRIIARVSYNNVDYWLRAQAIIVEADFFYKKKGKGKKIIPVPAGHASHFHDTTRTLVNNIINFVSAILENKNIIRVFRRALITDASTSIDISVVNPVPVFPPQEVHISCWECEFKLR